MARREINAKTDIAFEYEEIKEGRKVAALRFTIIRNARADKPDPLRDDPRLARLVTRLTTHGMTEDTARAIVQTHEPELVEWATTTLARKLKAKEVVENPAGWLRKAIEEDWRPQPTLFAQKQTLAREIERQAELERLNFESNTVKGRKADAAREKAAFMAYIGSLSAEERDALELRFREHLVRAIPAIVAKRFVGGATWCADPIIKASAYAYLGANRPDFGAMESAMRMVKTTD
jgi:hypothetical protein